MAHKENQLTLCSVFLLLAVPFSVSFANGDEDDEIRSPSAGVTAEINAGYVENVLPIVEKKCFDCHSEFTDYPWYHAIPGVKQFINYDIREGRQHLEMGKETPFLGTASVGHDLEEIIEVVEGDEMPPLVYRIMHWDSKLSDQEKETILTWARSSMEKVKN